MLFFITPLIMVLFTFMPLSRKLYFFYGISFCFFIFGGKYYNGWDWVEYEKFFQCANFFPIEDISKECLHLGKYEIGFIYIQELSRFISNNIQVFYMLISIINLSLWSTLLVNKTKNIHILWFFIFFYLLLGWMLWMQVLRQGLAISVLIWAIYFASQRKWVASIFLICLASQFHVSAILFFAVIPILAKTNLEKTKNFWLFYVTSISISIIINLFRNDILMLFQYLPLGEFKFKILNYILDEKFNSSSSIFAYMRGFAISSIVYLGLKVKPDNIVEIFFQRLGVLFVILSPIFSTFFFLDRFNLYLMISAPVLAAMLYRNNKHLSYAFIVSFILFLSPLRNTYGRLDFIPFNNYFLSIINNNYIDFQTQRGNIEYMQNTYSLTN